MSDFNLSGQTGPVAEFTIGRIAGSGYQIIDSAGPRAGELGELAIAALSDAAVDSASDDQRHQWITPHVAPQYRVAVQIDATDTSDAGTVRFRQWWFEIQPRTWQDFRRRVRRSLIAGTIGFLLGGIIVWYSSGRGSSGQSAGPPPRTKTVVSDSNVSDSNITDESAAVSEPLRTQPAALPRRLSREISRTQSLRNRVREYLNQPGFATDPSIPAEVRKRSVRLISDLDRSPPPVESIKLSNLEVRELLDLLDELQSLE